MVRYRLAIFVLFTSVTLLLSAGELDQSSVEYLDSFFANYQRPLTIFEFCGKSKVYAKKIAKDVRYDTTVALVLWGLSDTFYARTVKENIKNLLVCFPPRITPTTLETLSKCEHPDVVLVHDVPAYFRKMNKDFIRPFLGVGDYLGIDLEPSDMWLLERVYAQSSQLIAIVPHSRGDGGAFVLFKTGKPGIAVPRWNEAVRGKKQEIKYLVSASFTSKKMYKKDLRQYTIWQKGINLLTAVMLYIQLPDDKQIVKAVQKLAHLTHNDLVMSNLLIQDDYTIVPIDWDDPRHDISRTLCIRSLVDMFSKGRAAFDNPEEFVYFYREKLS